MSWPEGAIDYRAHAEFRVRFTQLGFNWIEGKAAGFTARGSTEAEIIERLADLMQEANWRPPSRRRNPPPGMPFEEAA
jgi:hypothetical protein